MAEIEQREILLPEGNVFVSIEEARGERGELPTLRVATSTHTGTDAVETTVKIKAHEYTFLMRVMHGTKKTWLYSRQEWQEEHGWHTADNEHIRTAGGNELGRYSPTGERLANVAVIAAQEYEKLVPDWRVRSKIAAMHKAMRADWHSYYLNTREAVGLRLHCAELEEGIRALLPDLTEDLPLPDFALDLNQPHFREIYGEHEWWHTEGDVYGNPGMWHVPGCPVTWRAGAVRKETAPIMRLLVKGGALCGCVPDKTTAVEMPDGSLRWRPSGLAWHRWAVVEKVAEESRLVSWHLTEDDVIAAVGRSQNPTAWAARAYLTQP
ncbi:hypothetical protein [Nonomuraea sp. SYSU D8015]|uniref:hypothetical protein n=1 Tax=Nonomuraea sp. SYSU D8015 TaxID=2593644 RepID=UPI00166142BF|nr:hypothetical protein [Nonomuraea sp. SYSU D8015]